MLGRGQEGACFEKGTAEAMCRTSSLYSDYIFSVGTTSLLHAAALSLVSPGCQILESYLWRSKAESVFHYSLTGVFPITHVSIFSSGHPGFFCGYLCQGQFLV